MKQFIYNNSVIILFISFFCSLANAQSSKKDMALMIDQQFKLAASQYKILEKNVPDSMMPKTVNKNTGKVYFGIILNHFLEKILLNLKNLIENLIEVDFMKL